MRRALAAITAALAILAMTACGGGGGGSTSSFNSGSTGSTGSTPPQPPALSLVASNFDTFGGSSITRQLQASGGTSPYTWATTQGFPTWLSLDGKTGTLTGTVPLQTPASAYATYPFNVTVTDSASTPQTKTFTINLQSYGQITLPPAATQPVLTATRGVSAFWQLYPQGGRGPFTVSVDSGLPAGLQASIDPNNTSEIVIQGTATQAGSFVAQLRIKDSEAPPQEVVAPLPINIDSKFTITTPYLRYGVIGRAYSDQLIAVNGTAPLAWTASFLPAGISLDASTGQLTGTPTAIFGGLNVTVKDSSSPPQSITMGIGLTILQEMSFPTTVPDAHLTSGYTQSLFNGGGVFPVTLKISSGSLPPGLTFSNNGYASGTPTATGAYSFTVTATDSDKPPVSLQQAFTLNVFTALPFLSDLPLPGGVLGKPYTAKIWVRDGTPPYHWSLRDGQLPPGLTMDPTGNISGTPTELPPYYHPSFDFNVAVTDSASPAQTAIRGYGIAIATQAKGRNDSIATPTPISYPGIDASFSPYADPADSTTSTPDSDYYRLLAPAGTQVTLSVGSSNLVDPVVEILDANGQRFHACRDVGDDNPTLTFIVKDTTPDAFDDECLNDDIDPTVNRTASLQFQVPGSTGAHTTFYAHVFDASGNARPDMTYHVDVSGVESPLTVTNTRLPGASIGVAYAGALPVGAGVKPYTVALANGTQLPPGMSLSTNANGLPILTGTPTTKGSYSFAVQVGDSSTPPAVVTVNVQIGVYDPLVINVDKFPDFTNGQPYSYVIPTSGGVPPLTWTAVGGPWCCITLNQTTGVWTGTFTGVVGQTYSQSVGFVDATGRTTGKTMTITVIN